MKPSYGVIIICGGKSSRMGAAKAALRFGDEVMLERIARIVRLAVSGPIVVVAAREQVLPALAGDVRIVFDEHEAFGPLEGLRVGLSALRDASASSVPSEIAFATGCDVPLLKPELVRHVCESLTVDFDAAVPRSAGFLHPLAAAFRIDTVLPHVERLVAAGKLRAAGLFDDVRSRILDETELRTVDPTLESLRNMNTPEEYRAFLRLAGFTEDSAAP